MKRKKRRVKLSKISWPRRRPLASRRKPERLKKSARATSRRLRSKLIEFNPLPVNSRIETPTPLADKRVLIFLVSKVVMTNS